jgi:hypothetical protein
VKAAAAAAAAPRGQLPQRPLTQGGEGDKIVDGDEVVEIDEQTNKAQVARLTCEENLYAKLGPSQRGVP